MTVKVVNTCTRPVALHLASGVVVVPALAEATCEAADLELGHVAELCRRGVLVVRPGPPPAPKKAAPRRSPVSLRTRGKTEKTDDRTSDSTS
jgi:hypothetical protein